jgi:hypothetical protein
VRVYLPCTMARLRSVLDQGVVEVVVGYAVTPALREWYTEGDVEELEYAATAAAARASLRLVAETGDQPRRVVLAAEVPDGEVRPVGGVGSDDRAAVALSAAVPLRQVESALLDDPSAADDVRAATEVLAAADAGDDDASFTVDAVEDHELGWYAAQELAVLVEVES